jgi:lipoate-protein ligase A
MPVQVFSDLFDVLPRDVSGLPDVNKKHVEADATFALIENDFTFGGRKVAGNAQAISRDRWVHHTSFLWDYKAARMKLLKEPEKRPDYRGDRKHSNFLTPLISLGYKRSHFVEGIEDALASRGIEPQPAGLHAAPSNVQPRLLT